MKILAPLNKPEWLDRYLEAGADEFYIGFDDATWLAEFGKYAELNRMSSFGYKANLPTLAQAISLADNISKSGATCYIALNSAGYSSRQLVTINEMLDSFAKHNISVIVGDLPLARICAEHGVSVTLSTMAGIYNSHAIGMLSRLGLKRIVLPRDVSIADIALISAKCPTIELEAFIMRNGCRYSDSNCMGYHYAQKQSLCKSLDEAKIIIRSADSSFSHMQEVYTNHRIFANLFHKQACGICGIYHLMNIGIRSLKIVGRADNPISVLSEISIVRRNIAIAEKSADSKHYLDNIEIPEHYFFNCLNGLNCYYPEVRYPKENSADHA